MRDEAGRFMPVSFKDKYPTGRKHCGRCRRWRPVSDFSVAQWEDYRRERPHKLQSRCQCCERVRVRTLHGHHQQQQFNPYPQGTPGWHAWRRDRKRERYHELRQDEEWVKLRREYYRIYGEAKRHESSAHTTDPGPDLSGDDGYPSVAISPDRQTRLPRALPPPQADG